jgi:hypothetical protein
MCVGMHAYTVYICTQTAHKEAGHSYGTCVQKHPFNEPFYGPFVTNVTRLMGASCSNGAI